MKKIFLTALFVSVMTFSFGQTNGMPITNNSSTNITVVIWASNTCAGGENISYSIPVGGTIQLGPINPSLEIWKGIEVSGVGVSGIMPNPYTCGLPDLTGT